VVDAKKSLDAIRSEVCDTTLVVLSWLAIAALAISFSRVFDIGWTLQHVGQVIACVIVWGIAIFRRRIPFQVRSVTIIAVLFWLGWTGQVYTPAPTSYVFFVSGAAMAAVFYGGPAGVAAVVLSVVITIATWAAITAGVFPTPTYATSMSLTTWLSRLASLVVAAAGPVIAISQFSRSLMGELTRAEAASDAKSAFLATMSHELRTPMTAIIGTAELLSEEKLAPQQVRKVDRIVRAGKNLLSLLNDLLDFAKIEAEQMALENGPFSLNEVLAEVRDLLTPLADEKHLTLRIEDNSLHDGLVGDPARLRQILHNLVGNAVKFTERGEIVIAVAKIEHTPGHVTLRIEVSDKGMGISPADQARLFQPFVQAQNFRSRTHGGTGLGLAISRRLAAQMKGELSVASDVGKGSTFTLTVTLPVAPAIGAPNTVTGETGPAARRTLRVLIAEDNDAIRELMREMVERRGHIIDCVVNGLMAVNALKARSYDVVIMDMHMPVMDGAEATAAIRALGTPQSAIPIVALTAGLTEDQRKAYLAAGVNQIVAKPAHWPTLFETIETLGAAFRKDGPPAPAPSAAPALPPPPPPPQPIDTGAKVFDDALFAELEAALGPDLMRASVETFRVGILDYLEKLDGALKAGDTSVARRLGHSIKGTCAQFGATEVSRLGAAIEAKTSTLDDMKQHAGAIAAAYARFNLVLDARMASSEAPGLLRKS